MKKLLFLLVVPALLSAQSSSENFTLTKSVMDAGGGASSSANFNLVSAFGQPTPIGIQSSETFALSAGFLNPLLAVSPSSPIQQLVIKQMQPDALLWWEPIANATSYSIHRAPSVEFTPGPGNFVATVTDTFYTDAGVLAGPAAQQYYIVLVNNP